jgi:hypothetical protein
MFKSNIEMFDPDGRPDCANCAKIKLSTIQKLAGKKACQGAIEPEIYSMVTYDSVSGEISETERLSKKIQICRYALHPFIKVEWNISKTGHDQDRFKTETMDI